MSDGITLGDARKALAAQPFSVLLGTRIAAFGDGGATLDWTSAPTFASRTVTCTAECSPMPPTTR